MMFYSLLCVLPARVHAVYTYVGCFTDENAFGAARVYFGDAAAANFAHAVATAARGGAPYFAVARNGTKGYGFIFNHAPITPR